MIIWVAITHLWYSSTREEESIQAAIIYAILSATDKLYYLEPSIITITEKTLQRD